MTLFSCGRRSLLSAAGLIFGLLLFCVPSSAADPSLTCTLGEHGIKTLSYAGKMLIKAHQFGLDTATLRRPDGTTYPSFTPTLTYKRNGDAYTIQVPWGTITCTYSQYGDDVLIDLRAFNASKAELAVIGACFLSIEINGNASSWSEQQRAICEKLVFAAEVGALAIALTLWSARTTAEADWRLMTDRYGWLADEAAQRGLKISLEFLARVGLVNCLSSAIACEKSRSSELRSASGPLLLLSFGESARRARHFAARQAVHGTFP